MVTIGFIGEGDTEKRILESERFREFLKSLNLAYIAQVENAIGKDNLSPEKVASFVKILIDRGADWILFLTDADGNCITSIKESISPNKESMVIVAVQAIEAWFLADTEAISTFMQRHYFCNNPEEQNSPFQFIKEEKQRLIGRGVRSKRLLCSRMLRSGFSVENAAHHPNCPSAKYFLDKLKQLATKQS